MKQFTRNIAAKNVAKSLQKRTFFIEHIQVHSKIERFQCKICNEIFLKKQDFWNHGKIHEGQEFGCEKCAAQFLSNKDLNDHLAGEHMKGKYKCKSCAHMYDDETILEQHIMKEY